MTLLDKVLRGGYQGMVLLNAGAIFLLAYRPNGLFLALLAAILSATLGFSLPFLVKTRWLRWMIPREK